MTKKGPQVLIIGLGEIGYNNAEYMSHRGLNVDGYDIEDKVIEQAIHDGVIAGRSASFRGYDFYVICISTHKPRNIFSPFVNGILGIAREISKEGKTGGLVSIESTVTRGTSSSVNQILKHRLHVVHFPHRFYAKDKEKHGIRQVRVLGGCEECCTQKAKYFYGKLLGIPLHLVSSVELAELSKIVENSYRFLGIAFTEELKMFCDAYAINYSELRSAINSKWNTKIFEAQKGIGGHCLPKDTEMYLDLLNRVVRHNMIEAAKKIDYLYKLDQAQKVRPKIGIPMTRKPLAKIPKEESFEYSLIR